MKRVVAAKNGRRWLGVTVVLAAMWLLALAGASAQNIAAADTLLLPVGEGRSAAARAADGINLMLNRRDERALARTDTTYIRRAEERWRLRVNLNMSGSDITTRAVSDGTQYETSLEAQRRVTMSFGVSYRGLSLAVAVNPAKLAGKNKDMELNLTAYGNRVGADAVYQSARTFKGTAESGGMSYDIPIGIVSQEMALLNAYYVFNARRFSYPAAYSQSWTQLRSCGSLMAGLSLSDARLRIRPDAATAASDMRLDMALIGIGLGYGYNLVVSHRWLVHLSSVPQLVVFNRSRLEVDSAKEKSPYRFPNIIAVGRIAVVRHFDRCFAGMSAMVNTVSTGDPDRLWLNTVKWRARMFFGIKL